MKKYFLAAFVVSASAAQAYTSVGNGIDNRLISHFRDNVPWFLRDKGDTRPLVITVCSSPNLPEGVTMKNIEDYVDLSFDYWSRHTPPLPRNVGRYVFAHAFRAECLGDEDLRIQFDLFTAEMFGDFGWRLEPIAQAVRSQNPFRFRPKGADWQGGVLWLTGENQDFTFESRTSDGVYHDKIKIKWTPVEKLMVTILHEMGHVFGHNHVTDGTLMDPEVVRDSLLYFP